MEEENKEKVIDSETEKVVEEPKEEAPVEEEAPAEEPTPEQEQKGETPVLKEEPVSEEKKDEKEEESSEKPKEDETSKEQSDSPKEDLDDDFEDEDVSFDFSAIKNKVKALRTKKEKKHKEPKKEHKTHKHHKKEHKDTDIAFDATNLKTFTKKHSKWLIPLALILIAVFLSSYFRVMPAYLPATDAWAENTINDFYQNNIRNQVNQQYPNLPEQNKEALVASQYQDYLKQNKDLMEQEKARLSEQFKSQLQDDDGQTYLLAIDPYHWYSMAKNYEKNGHFGDEISEEGVSRFNLRNGREGKNLIVQPFNSLVMVVLHKVMSIFSNVSLLTAAFYLPVVLIGLSIIPAFFITRKIGGNLGGLFAGIIIAINTSLLGRTPAGFSDTDAYNIIFPLFIIWFLLEAFETDDWRKSLGLAALSGLSTGLFAFAWRGWWYIFDFIIAGIVIYLVYLAIINFNTLKEGFSKFLNKARIKTTLWVTGIYILFSGIFVTIFLKKFDKFYTAPLQPLDVITFKEVATTKIWPNVLTTVAEFNEIAFKRIFGQLGGNLFFAIAVLGIIFAIWHNFYRKDNDKVDVKYAIFIVIWLAGTMYSFTKGMRFALLAVPPFAIAFGIGLGKVYYYVSEWLSKAIKLNINISKILLIGVFCLLLISPLEAANDVGRSEIPSMNDAWRDMLLKIKANSDDAVITSWWDFGHWFYAISERRVTFDGADQGERIHWVGKSLLTSDEQTSVGILRMLNCGQERPVHLIEETLAGGKENFNEQHAIKAVNLLNKMMVTNDKTEAIKLLKQEDMTNEEVAEIIKITYCEDLIDQFFITSEDMVGKAGVWGHFGSWDFRKAAMYSKTNKLSRAEAVPILVNEFGLSEEDAANTHTEIKSNTGDQWISPWPGYQGGTACQDSGENLECLMNLGDGRGIPFVINKETKDISVPGSPQQVYPNSIVYATKEGIVEKKFEGELLGVSFVLRPNSNHLLLVHPLQAKSMFTQLFYFNGHGLKCFSNFDDRESFSGGRIATWKVDFDCRQENQIYFKEELAKPVPVVDVP